MKVEKDYEELIELLNKHDVKYCVIGSFALAVHAKPRYTKDLDILISNDLLTSAAGCSFAEVWRNKVTVRY